LFDASTDLYDAIYLSLKDYAHEAGRVAGWIRSRRADASTVLDVACGTGEHARHLRGLGFDVDGVDVSADFAAIAAAKNPEGDFRAMDMVELDLGRRYDAVLCLFSSIGYVKTESKLRRAIAGMAAHVVPGGLLVIEPWLAPGVLTHGKVSVTTAEDGERTICRMSRTSLERDLSVLEFEYLIGSAEGIERRREVHELGLFTPESMQGAMQDAGLDVEYDPEGLTGRGVYIGTGVGKARDNAPAG
jgi:SAM-dependent methyltransferase